MKKTGEFLKNEREQQSISLNEISMSTKISVRMLRAIEEGDLNSLPAKTFLRGFVQSYATHLKIDVDRSLEIFHEEMGSTLVKPEVEDANASIPEVQEEKGSSSAPIKTESDSQARTAIESDKQILNESKILRTIRQKGLVSKAIYAGLVALLIFLIVGVRNVVTKYEKESLVEKPTDLKGLEALENQVTENPEAAAQKNESAQPSAKNDDLPKSSPEPEAVSDSSPAQPTPSDSTPKGSKDSKDSKITGSIDTAQKPGEVKISNPSPPLNKPESNIKDESATTKRPPPNTINSSVGPNEVIIEALDEVDIEFRIGEGDLQKLTLGPDQVHTIKAQSQVRIDFSDGGAVNITHNGRDRGVPGDLGKPKKVVLP